MSVVDNATHLRWQREAHRILDRFLDAALACGLPAITWTIPTSGSLVGDVDGLTSTPAEQRRVFEAWVRHLGATVWPERTDSDGIVHLYARFEVAAQPAGAICADITPTGEGGDRS